MKKSLLALAAMGLAAGLNAQTPSPFWTTLQNTNFPHASAGLIFMDVVDANTVWGVGNYGSNGRGSHLYTRTINSGTAWASGNIFPDTNTYVIANIDGVDANTAWVAAYERVAQAKGVIYKTSNGGTTWANGGNVTMFANAAAFANWVAFTSTNVGVAMGDPNPGTTNEFEIWRTTNAGTTWSLVAGASIPNPTSGEYGLTNSYTTFGNNIWFGTNKGRVLRSADAGLTWSVSTTGATGDVTRLAFTDASNGLVLGTTGTAQNLYRTTDGGATWSSLGQPTNLGYNDISPITGTTWFASASNPSTSISYSSDQGTTWNTWGGSGIGYLTIGFANSSTGWAGTFSDASLLGGVYKYSGSPLGVANLNAAPKAINMYPNPSNGLVYISLPSAKSGLTLTITDALGNQVYQEKTITTSHEERVLDLKHLAKGIYFMNIAGENEKFFQKIVIE